MNPVSERMVARRRVFARVLTAISVTVHVPVALAATALLRRLGFPLATPFGIAWAVLMAVAFVAVSIGSFPDHRRSLGFVAFVEIPTSIESCAAAFSLIPSLIATVALVGYRLATRAPLELPMTAYMAIYVLGLAVCCYGSFIRRRHVRVLHREVHIQALDPRLHGMRIAHISDLHIGTLTSKAWGLAWAKETRRQNPDLVLVTGDLVTSGTDFFDDVVEILTALKTHCRVIVSFGNHDYFGDAEGLASKLGGAHICLLRNEGIVLEHRGAPCWVAGVDDTWTHRADVERALADRPSNMTTLMLAHDPALFGAPACDSVDLVLSGHTHGGQVAIPLLERKLNLSRLTTPYCSGIYRRGRATLHVSPGLGTTGPPIRLGAAPEITLLVLRG